MGELVDMGFDFDISTEDGDCDTCDN
jgi:hypothetical protein